MMQAGTLIDLISASVAPITGRSAPRTKYSRQCDMTAMKRSGSIFIKASRFRGRAAIAPVKDHDSVTRIGHSLRERLHAPKVTPAAGGKRHPGAVIAEHFVVDIDTAHIC